jgi:hypothetical protein
MLRSIDRILSNKLFNTKQRSLSSYRRRKEFWPARRCSTTATDAAANEGEEDRTKEKKKMQAAA